jgi:Rod binding domain-containing protein
MPDTILSLGSSLRGGLLGAQSSNFSQPGTNRRDDPSKVHHAAQQFESLLISQILKGAHDDSEGWLGTGDDQAANSAMGIAEEQFAQAISARGGLGLASLIEKGLTKSTNATDR